MKLGHVTQIRDEGFIIASPRDLRYRVPTVRVGLMMTNVSLCRLQWGERAAEKEAEENREDHRTESLCAHIKA